MAEFAQILINSIGAVAVAFISYFFQQKLTERFFKSLDENNHTINDLSGKIAESTEVIHSIYQQNVNLVNEVHSLKLSCGKKIRTDQ